MLKRFYIFLFGLTLFFISANYNSVFAYACKSDCGCDIGQIEKRYCGALGDTCGGGGPRLRCGASFGNAFVNCSNWYAVGPANDCPSDVTPPPPPPPATTGTINGVIYCANNPNIRVPNIKVSVKDSGNGIIRTTTTNANGEYSMNFNMSGWTGSYYAVRTGENPLVSNDATAFPISTTASGSGCAGPHESCPYSSIDNKTVSGFDFVSNSSLCDSTPPVCGAITFSPSSGKGDMTVNVTSSVSDTGLGISRWGMYVLGPDGVNRPIFPNDQILNPLQNNFTTTQSLSTVGLPAGNYKIQMNYWDGSPIASPVGYTGNFAQCTADFNLERDNTVHILGSVFNQEDLDNNASTIEGNFYGQIPNTSCNGSRGRSGPDYEVSYTVEGAAETVTNNECLANGQPIYTFNGKNPKLNSTQGKATLSIKVKSQDTAYAINEVVVSTTNSQNQLCKPTQRFSFPNTSMEQTISNVDVYSEGDCKYSHVWFISRSDVPDCSLLDGPYVRGSDNTYTKVDPLSLEVNKSYYFKMTIGGGRHNAPVTNLMLSRYKNTNLFACSIEPGNSQVATKGSGEYDLVWTPTANDIGEHNLFGRVWNDGISECRADCVDGPPRYLCENADKCKFMVKVNPQTQSLTCSSTPITYSTGAPFVPNTTQRLTVNIPAGANLVSGSWNDTNANGIFSNFNANQTSVDYRIPALTNANIVLKYDIQRGSQRITCSSPILTQASGPSDLQMYFVSSSTSIIKPNPSLVYNIEANEPSWTTSYLYVAPDALFNSPIDIKLGNNGNCGNEIVCSFSVSGLPKTTYTLQNLPDNNGDGIKDSFYVPVYIKTIKELSNIQLNATLNATSIPNFIRTDSITINSFENFNIAFEFAKFTPSDISELTGITNSSDYCLDFVKSKPSYSANQTMGVVIANSTTELLNKNISTPSSEEIRAGFDYTFELTPNSGLDVLCIVAYKASDDSEIKSITDSRFLSLDLTTDIRLYAVMAISPQYSWFQAYGGNLFAHSKVSNPKLLDKTLTDNSTIAQSGLFSVGFTDLLNNLVPSDIVSHSKYSLYPHYVLKSFDTSSKDAINSLSKTQFDSIDFDSTDKQPSLFVVEETDVVIDSNINGSVPQLVYILGDLKIKKDVTKIVGNFYVFGSIIIEGEEPLNQNNTKNIEVIGSLVSNKTVELGRNKPSLINAELTERVYYNPAVYFADSTANPIKISNVYANVID